MGGSAWSSLLKVVPVVVESTLGSLVPAVALQTKAKSRAGPVKAILDELGDKPLDIKLISIALKEASAQRILDTMAEYEARGQAPQQLAAWGALKLGLQTGNAAKKEYHEVLVGEGWITGGLVKDQNGLFDIKVIAVSSPNRMFTDDEIVGIALRSGMVGSHNGDLFYLTKN
jgi:hypothetical protein